MIHPIVIATSDTARIAMRVARAGTTLSVGIAGVLLETDLCEDAYFIVEQGDGGNRRVHSCVTVITVGIIHAVVGQVAARVMI